MRWTRIVAACLLFASVSAAMAVEYIALMKNTSGDVKVRRNGEATAATAGLQLMRNDVVLTGKDASGAIAFLDGTTMTLDAGSELELSRYAFEPAAENYDFSVFLRKGTAVYSSGKLGKLAPQSVELNTPRATVGVRGTRFILQTD